MEKSNLKEFKSKLNDNQILFRGIDTRSGTEKSFVLHFVDNLELDYQQNAIIGKTNKQLFFKRINETETDFETNFRHFKVIEGLDNQGNFFTGENVFISLDDNFNLFRLEPEKLLKIKIEFDFLVKTKTEMKKRKNLCIREASVAFFQDKTFIPVKIETDEIRLNKWEIFPDVNGLKLVSNTGFSFSFLENTLHQLSAILSIASNFSYVGYLPHIKGLEKDGSIFEVLIGNRTLDTFEFRRKSNKKTFNLNAIQAEKMNDLFIKIGTKERERIFSIINRLSFIGPNFDFEIFNHLSAFQGFHTSKIGPSLKYLALPGTDKAENKLANQLYAHYVWLSSIEWKPKINNLGRQSGISWFLDNVKDEEIVEYNSMLKNVRTAVAHSVLFAYEPEKLTFVLEALNDIKKAFLISLYEKIDDLTDFEKVLAISYVYRMEFGSTQI